MQLRLLHMSYKDTGCPFLEDYSCITCKTETASELSDNGKQ